MSRIIVSLNGAWDIRFDPSNSGIKEGWVESEWPEPSRSVTVPSTWNLIEPEYEGVAFYRRVFALSAEHRDKKARLRFGAVNYFAEVWVNGILAGGHEGGYTPFELDISGAVRFGEDNTVTVRVVDPPNDGSGREIDGLRHMEIPSGKESWYVNFSGVWQDVELILSEHFSIEQVFVTPDLKRKMVRASMSMHSDDSSEAIISFRVTTPDGGTELAHQARPVFLDRGYNLINLDIPLSDFRVWTLEDPALYVFTTRIRMKGLRSDTVETRFGMRSFEMSKNSFYLNGERIVLRGLLHQQQYPKNLAYPESKEEARRIIRTLKEGGWNLIRAHIRPAAPVFLEVCDEEGMLVFEEPAIGWIVDSDRLRERAINEVREMVRRDRNHPSVVMWGILNESGVRGAPDIMGRTKMYWNQGEMGIQKIKNELARVIRDEDPYRFITDDSGAVTCNYYLPESYEPVSYFDNHLYMSYPLSHAGFEVFRNLGRSEDFFRSHQFDGFDINHRIGGGSPEKLFLQSEFGCGGLPVWPEVLAAFDDGSGVTYRDEAVYRSIDAQLREYYDRELRDVFPSYEDALRETQEAQALSVRRMIEALRANPLCAGYVLTQLHDNDYECNAGLLDPLFRPKRAYHAAREANRPLRIVLESFERVISPGGDFTVTAYIVNDAGITGALELELAVAGPNGAGIRSDRIRVKARDAVQEIYTFVVRDTTKHGIYQVKATLMDDSETLDTASSSVHVIPRTTPGIKPRPFALVPFGGKVRDYLGRNKIRTAALVLGEGPVKDAAFYVVEPINSPEELADSRLRPVLEKVRQGADALFLGLPLLCLSDADEKLQELRDQGKFVCWCSPTELETDLFGFPVMYFDSKPRFAGPYHYFKKHPVFTGLDAGHVLDDRFANVMPLTSLRIEGAQTLGGVFGTPAGYHFKIKGCEHARDPRHGADLCVVPYGEGRLIFSTYRLEHNLADDPVAGKLLWNMLGAV